MKKWGEKAAGLRFMHTHSGLTWKNFANKLSIASILITTLASTINLCLLQMFQIKLSRNVLM